MFRKYFKLPLHQDENCEIYIKDFDNQVVFNWVYDIPKDLKNNIIKKINGEINDNLGEFISISDKIYLGDHFILKVRGWGYLTGTVGLSNKDACDVQDSLTNYVLDKLNENL